MRTLRKLSPTVLAVGLLTLALAGVTIYILLQGLKDERAAAKADAIANAYVAALQRAFFIPDGERPTSPAVFLNAREGRKGLCTPDKIPAADAPAVDDANVPCWIAEGAPIDKDRPHAAICAESSAQMCVSLMMEPAIYNDAGLEQRALEVLKDPCAYLLDLPTLQESHTGQDVIAQRRARDAVGCDVTPKPARRVIVAHGKNVMVLEFQ